eukprot:SM000139S00126  [mRNA]  locus=s139:279507:280162:- [translate_table: standard]
MTGEPAEGSLTHIKLPACVGGKPSELILSAEGLHRKVRLPALLRPVTPHRRRESWWRGRQVGATVVASARGSAVRLGSAVASTSERRPTSLPLGGPGRPPGPSPAHPRGYLTQPQTNPANQMKRLRDAPRGGRPRETPVQLSTTDILALATMKNAAKCDT